MFGSSVPANLLVAAEFLAISCAAVFAGAATYINLVEHPARMSLDTRAAAEQWAPSYRRATLMQAPLAILSFLAGCAAWFLGGGTAWLIAALLIGVVVPFTLVVIKPTNDELLASGRRSRVGGYAGVAGALGQASCSAQPVECSLDGSNRCGSFLRPDRYSAFAPLSRTTLAHFTSSLFT